MIKLTEYIRKSSRYLRAGDVKDGDVVEIISEGRIRPAEESRFGRESFEIDVRLSDGSEKVWTVNKTTLQNLAEVYGDETKNWVGRKVYLAVRTREMRNEPRKVILGFPDAVVEFLLKDVRKVYPDRVDIDTLSRLMKNVRGFKMDPEEAARAAGLRIVEEGGRKYVVFR